MAVVWLLWCGCVAVVVWLCGCCGVVVWLLWCGCDLFKDVMIGDG